MWFCYGWKGNKLKLALKMTLLIPAAYCKICFEIIPYEMSKKCLKYFKI